MNTKNFFNHFMIYDQYLILDMIVRLDLNILKLNLG